MTMIILQYCATAMLCQRVIDLESESVVNYRPTATNYDKLPTAGGKYVTLTAKWHK